MMSGGKTAWTIAVTAIVSLVAALWLTRARRSSIAVDSLVIKGGRLIDCAGQSPMENAVVVIEGEKIKTIFREAEGRIPDRAKVIAATGKTIMPGLIDVHVHLGGSAGAGVAPEEYTLTRELHDLKAYLYSGVTTIKSLGDSKDHMLDLRRREHTGQILAPRIFTTGKVFTAPGGHPVSTIFARAPQFVIRAAVYQVDAEEQARAGVRALAADQVDGIKIIYDSGTSERPLPKLTLDLLRLIIAEAHKAKLIVSVHCGSGQDVKDAVLAGADGIEHAGQENLQDETLKLMAERGVFYSPTLAVYDALLKLAKGANPADDALGRACVMPMIIKSLTRPRSVMAKRWKAGPRVATKFEHRLETAKTNVRRAMAAGVKIVAGTDAGNLGTFHGPAIHRELALLVEAGLTPFEAIAAATRNASAYIGAQQRIGTIEVGKLADILIVDGDPIKDISSTKRISLVMKSGKEIDRENLFVEASAGR